MAEPLFEMYRGDDYTLRVEITDDNDDAIDITGWSFISSMKLSTELPDEDATVSIDVPAVSGFEAEAGVVYISYPNSQTSDLLVTDYVMDLQRVFNNKVITILSGKVKILGDVTRRIV